MMLFAFALPGTAELSRMLWFVYCTSSASDRPRTGSASICARR